MNTRHKFFVCNNSKLDSMNKDISLRIFNIDHKRRNIINYRNDYFICKEYTDLNNNNKDLQK